MHQLFSSKPSIFLSSLLVCLCKPIFFLAAKPVKAANRFTRYSSSRVPCQFAIHPPYSFLLTLKLRLTGTGWKFNHPPTHTKKKPPNRPKPRKTTSNPIQPDASDRRVALGLGVDSSSSSSSSSCSSSFSCSSSSCCRRVVAVKRPPFPTSLSVAHLAWERHWEMKPGLVFRSFFFLLCFSLSLSLSLFKRRYASIIERRLPLKQKKNDSR